MRKPRILINALSLSLGGGRTYVLNLLRELNRDTRGFHFTLLVGRGTLSPDEVGSLEIEEVGLPAGSYALSVGSRILYEETVLPWRARRFDLLYCLADLAPPVATTPTVVLFRNLNIYDHHFYDNLRLRTLERLVRLGMPRARRIVFPSQAAVQLIGEKIRIPADRIAVIPHGISTESFASASPSVAGDARYLFLPAPLERHKNIGVLIESVLHLQDPELQVWIAGGDTTDPEHARELRDQVARLGLGERVRFLGPVPYAEILSYYRAAEALVFPSLIETFGHPLLEAMLAGTPIVAADILAFREVAGDTALYFPPSDPAALAAAAEAVRADPEATARRIESARERAGQFTSKRSLDRLCGVFEEVLREAAP
jgi:glycosyltransferase involved in cell wall biosynthesis